MTATVDVLRRRELWIVAGGLSAVTVTAGLVTGLCFAAGARAVLDVHFTALPATAGEAAAIWLHNARSTLGVAVFALVRPVSRRLLDGGRPVWDRLLVGVCDVMVGAWAAGSAIVAGVLVGAYGGRQLAVFLPDGPVEVTAWLLLLVLYVDVRRDRVSLRQAAGRGGVILLLLGVAAVLELAAGL